MEHSYNRKISAVTAAFTTSDEQLRAKLKAVERRSNEHIVALTSAAEIQSAQNATLAAKLQQAQVELEQRVTNVETQQRENLALKAQVEQHKKQIDELSAANLEGRRQIEQLEALQTTSKNQIAALTAEKDQKQQALQQQEEKKQQQITSLSATIDQQTSRIAELTVINQNNERRISDFEKNAQELQQQLSERNVTAEHSKAQIAKQHENQVEQHQKQIGELTAANLEGRRQIEQHQLRISTLTSDLACSAQKLEALQTTSKNQIAALYAEIDQKQQSLREQEETCKKKQQQITSLNDTIAAINQRNERRISDLEKNAQAQITKLSASEEKTRKLIASEEKTRKLLADTTAYLVAQADSILAGDSKIPKDIERAALMLLEAAKGGSPLAMFKYAKCLQDGVGVPAKDLVQAERFFRDAAAQKHVDAIASLAELVLASKPAEAVKLWEEAEQLGSVVSKIRLGNCYVEGVGGVSKDTAKGATLYYEAGRKLYNGDEICKDLPQAAKLFKEAVALGSTIALYWRGVVLYEGSGTPVDYVEAKRMFELSIEKASMKPYASFWMHFFYRDGKGDVVQSYPKAAEWIDKAIAGGFLQAMVTKAEFFLKGHPGIPKNVAEAKKLLKLAADSGDKDAMQKLEALCAELGELDELLYTQEPPAGSIQVLDLCLFS
jgi:TPR repeat protein